MSGKSFACFCMIIKIHVYAEGSFTVPIKWGGVWGFCGVRYQRSCTFSCINGLDITSSHLRWYVGATLNVPSQFLPTVSMIFHHILAIFKAYQNISQNCLRISRLDQLVLRWEHPRGAKNLRKRWSQSTASDEDYLIFSWWWAWLITTTNHEEPLCNGPS